GSPGGSRIAALAFWARRTNHQATPDAPFRRPSGVAVQGSERHGCRKRRKGPWMALVRRPSGAATERGNPGAAGAGCRGKRFWLLLPRLAKVTRPAGRNKRCQHLGNRPGTGYWSPKKMPISFDTGILHNHYSVRSNQLNAANTLAVISSTEPTPSIRLYFGVPSAAARLW